MRCLLFSLRELTNTSLSSLRLHYASWSDGHFSSFLRRICSSQRVSEDHGESSQNTKTRHVQLRRSAPNALSYTTTPLSQFPLLRSLSSSPTKSRLSVFIFAYFSNSYTCTSLTKSPLQVHHTRAPTSKPSSAEGTRVRLQLQAETALRSLFVANGKSIASLTASGWLADVVVAWMRYGELLLSLTDTENGRVC